MAVNRDALRVMCDCGSHTYCITDDEFDTLARAEGYVKADEAVLLYDSESCREWLRERLGVDAETLRGEVDAVERLVTEHEWPQQTLASASHLLARSVLDLLDEETT